MEFVCHADLCDLIGDLGFSGVDREFGYCLLLRFGWRRTGNGNDRSRSPSGMTSKEGNGKSNGDVLVKEWYG
jgi:hypothetical protein